MPDPNPNPNPAGDAGDAAKAAADKAAADKAAADKVAADHVAAGRNPDGSAKTATVPAGDPPKVPDTYALKLPEKSPFVEADLAHFSAEAKALKLTAEQAQTMVDERVKLIDSSAAAYLTAVQADKDLGGANFERTTTLAIAGRDKFLEGLPDDEKAEVLGWFNRYGIGNHKALVRAFARLGQLIAEDKPLSSVGDGKPTPKPGSTAAITAKLYPNTPGAGE